MADEEEEVVVSPGSPDPDIDHSDEETTPGENGQTKTPARKGKARLNYLASHKIIEKKRRDRINNALTTLGHIVPDCVQIGPSKKLDKALTLENTITYIERIQQSGMAAGLPRPGLTIQNTVTHISQWVSENWKSSHTTEHFVQQLLGKMNSLVEDEGDANKGIKRENDASQRAHPSVLVGVGPGMVPPVLPLQAGAPRFDGRQPQLLPVVPPANNPLGAAAATLFSAQLRPQAPDAAPEQSPAMFQQQVLLQQGILHGQNPTFQGFLNPAIPAAPSPAPVPIAQAYVPTSMTPQPPSPFVTQSTEQVVQQVPNTSKTWQQPQPDPPPPMRTQVVFSANTSGGDSDAEGMAPRPKRLNLGLTIQNSATTPGAFSTVSTPRGANTPGGDDVLDLQSPNGVKQFPFNSGSMTPRGSYRQKAVPPPTLSIEAANALPPPPEFDAPPAAPPAITPQRQSLANSLLELSGQTITTFNPQGGDLHTGLKEATAILSPANASLEDPMAAIPGDPRLEMNPPSFRAQLMQQFSPRLHDKLPTNLPATAANDYTSAGVTPTVEPETPVGMPMLTTDQRSIPLSQHMDASARAMSADETEWVNMAQTKHHDEDSSNMPDSGTAAEVNTPHQTDPASSLLMLSRQHDINTGVTSPPQ